MSSSHQNDTQPMSGMVDKTQELLKRIEGENQELLKRIEGDLNRNVWIGTHIRSYPEPPSSNPPYTGPNRRGMGVVTVKQIAGRLEVKPSDIVFLAKRNYIPGAYEVDGEWFFDGRYLRIWYDDFQKGIVSIPH